MDPNSLANTLDAKYSKLLAMDPFPGESYFLDFIALTVDAEFQKATSTLPNIDITTPAGTLTFPVASEELMPDIIGNQCAAYWSVTITNTGIPVNICTEVPSTIVSVSNDANKIASVISNGLKALAGSSVPVVPYYLGFTNVIIEAVKTIIWTVNEVGTNPIGSPCIGTYSVTVS